LSFRVGLPSQLANGAIPFVTAVVSPAFVVNEARLAAAFAGARDRTTAAAAYAVVAGASAYGIGLLAIRVAGPDQLGRALLT